MNAYERRQAARLEKLKDLADSRKADHLFAVEYALRAYEEVAPAGTRLLYKNGYVYRNGLKFCRLKELTALTAGLTNI